jgi:HSP20 family protein
MAIIKKDKDNKIAVTPSDQKHEITPMRPYDLWSEMDRMFDSFRSNFDSLFWPWEHRGQQWAQHRTPPMDVADLGDHYMLRLEMPGIPKDDINIEVTANSIEVSATHDETTEEKEKNYLRRERSNARFYRALELPEELNIDNVNAELKDGVLKISLPKIEPRPEQRPKKITIK